ncbi:hypothetical protein HMPREF0518_1434 [Lactobacillus helveticus DSM 20075 = CGMCC 1.1877]|nr:hypothetical protein HMPREF0518_1434 [Lactobacillus helveticus DSM 20075 = CGMCC 1.1877]
MKRKIKIINKKQIIVYRLRESLVFLYFLMKNMKQMSSLAYHFGIKLRFYPSSKQKKIIKLNYDAQRFVYNSYAGRNRTNYHARRFLAVKQINAMPFAFLFLMIMKPSWQKQ